MRPYGEITKAILLGVGIAGVVTVAAVAPGALLTAKPFMRDPYRLDKKHKKQKAMRAVRRLQENNLLIVKEKNGVFIWELTKEGKQKFQEIQLREKQLAKLRIYKPPQWDGKWRVVIFDIPEEVLRSARGMFRARLRQWEFYPLQKSVWACPWPCEKEIQTAAKIYGISGYVDIIIAERIYSDDSLRNHFKV